MQIEDIRINSQSRLCNANVSVPSTAIRFIAEFRIFPDGETSLNVKRFGACRGTKQTIANML